MTFELLPTIDVMLDLYEKPRSIERFQEYLKILAGDTKSDLGMPVSGFNPMAKEHVIQKLNELKDLQAESIMLETLTELNKTLIEDTDDSIFKVALNLSDDLKGGWTNRYTSDYDSKFRINALVKRKFCAPIFWTSETFTGTLIRERTLEYVYRTIYWLSHPRPKTLKEHVEQERFVGSRTKYGNKRHLDDCDTLKSFLQEHHDSDNYHIIFNFLYGDEASRSLSFPVYGVKDEMRGLNSGL